MIQAIRHYRDRLLGRGEASITVPVLDGGLKPNRMIEDAAVVAELDAPEDLSSDGTSVYLADRDRVLRLEPRAGGAAFAEVTRVEGTVTALACLPGGGVALAVNGREVRIVGGPFDSLRMGSAEGVPFRSVNALAPRREGSLLVTDGSRAHPAERWAHDLMDLGRTGRAIEIDLAAGSARAVASGLAFAFGAQAVGDDVWISESWRHRVVRAEAGRSGSAVLAGLPAYPSRLAPAGDGDVWLTCFTMRTQLVEFVLREPAFRKRMIREIEAPYWIAPALNSGNTYLEPMQGAQLKTMGVVKPWAPPRSYGLIIRLSPQGLPRYSLHSRFDGKHHGVVAAAECGGELYLLAKGCRRLLSLPLADLEERLLA